MKNKIIICLMLAASAWLLTSCSLFDSPDTIPPVFSGAKGLVSYRPEIYVPESVYFHLTWEAATDNVTPQGRIVYLVYRSAGAINYSAPELTTAPGVLSADVSCYFLDSCNFAVRARDEAGNIDSNTIVLSYAPSASAVSRLSPKP